MRVLITGAAGFIGYHTAKSYLEKGHEVIGVDSLTDYYSVSLKKMRVEILREHKNYSNHSVLLENYQEINKIIAMSQPSLILHLAAQAGVRLPISSYQKYVDSNLIGFSNIMLSAVNNKIANVVYASSSSVYGENQNGNFRETDQGLSPISFYGATKLANEILAASLAKNSSTKFRGLRFFTVYGPWGRPDMAYFKLIASAVIGKPFTLFGDGTIRRDFTFIADAVRAIVTLGEELSSREGGYSDIVNIGGGNPYSMQDLINAIEEISAVKIEIRETEGSKADVLVTNADANYLKSLINFVPSTTLSSGISQCISWAKETNIEANLPSWLE